jgi:hypothetical protein
MWPNRPSQETNTSRAAGHRVQSTQRRAHTADLWTAPCQSIDDGTGKRRWERRGETSNDNATSPREAGMLSGVDRPQFSQQRAAASAPAQPGPDRSQAGRPAIHASGGGGADCSGIRPWLGLNYGKQECAGRPLFFGPLHHRQLEVLYQLGWCTSLCLLVSLLWLARTLARALTARRQASLGHVATATQHAKSVTGKEYKSVISQIQELCVALYLTSPHTRGFFLTGRHRRARQSLGRGARGALRRLHLHPQVLRQSSSTTAKSQSIPVRLVKVGSFQPARSVITNV